MHSSFNCVNPAGVKTLFLLLFFRLDRAFVFSECASHCPRFLGTKVLGSEALGLVELSQVVLLGLVDDGQDSGDRLPYGAAAQQQ